MTDNKNLSVKTESVEDAVLTERIGKTTYTIGLHFKANSSKDYSDCVKKLMTDEIQKM